MAVAVVQHKPGTAASSVIAITLTTTPVVGNVLALFLNLSSSNTAWATPTGFTFIASQTNTNCNIYAYYRVVQSGDGTSWSFTVPATGAAQGELAEFSGVDTSTPIDAHGSTNGTSATISTGSATPTTSGDYAFGSLVYNGPTKTYSGTPTNSYTSLDNNVGSRSEFIGLAGPTSGVATSSSDTLSGSEQFAGFLMILKAGTATTVITQPTVIARAVARASYR